MLKIQCAEIKGEKPILLISAYMPCRGLTNNVEDYSDCLDQLREIITKYSCSHSIILGGDMNEDMELRDQSVRGQLLKNCVEDFSLKTSHTSHTYCNPDGVLITTLDYIFYSEDIAQNVTEHKSLVDLQTNVSDHIPILCQFKYDLDKVAAADKDNNNIRPSVNIRWNKLDKVLYNSKLSSQIQDIDIDIDTIGALDSSVMELNDILDKCARAAAPSKEKRPRKAKLRVWTPEIQSAIAAKKEAFYKWKMAGRPEHKENQTVINKKKTTSMLRQLCRREMSQKSIVERQVIMESKSSDMALFHKLINKQRGKLSSCINELHVGKDIFRGEQDILAGWHQHFGQLATPTQEACFDADYRKLFEMELREIRSICRKVNDSDMSNSITEDEVSKAIKSLNKGKSPDVYNICAEHLANGAEVIVPTLTVLLNKMWDLGVVPESLKLGILTPVFKRKGSNLDAKNYRGITVTPILSKVLETVLRERVKPIIAEHQNKLQRGFTEGSSPMNCSLILEESIRENKDNNLPTYVAFLDSKSAFDVVNQSSLKRKLFHWGIEGQLWNLIDSLHTQSETMVKWGGIYSDRFEVHQGIKQGGILSTDMYKIYNNKLLDRLAAVMLGIRIGGINCVAPTCADDTTVVTNERSPLQTLLSISDDYSNMEHYLLQLLKSVVLSVPPPRKKSREEEEYQWTLKGEPMPNVTQTMHMGIMRSANTEQSATQENIQKARRTLYSLMSSGLHGENGLDPESAIHLMQTYVLPVLVYGMEVVLPRPKYIDLLEKFNKKFLKLIMSLPVTTADPAVYVLSGTLPVEATIHKRALTFFGSICRLPEASIEHQLARRQLSIKTDKSHSWFIAMREIFQKYSLPDPYELLGSPPGKLYWKGIVNKHVNSYWEDSIKSAAVLFMSLRFLNVDEFSCGKRHSLLKSLGNIREVPRISTKLKLVTGTYILQTNRVAFNQNQVDPSCLLCHQEDETVEHFLLRCPALASVRNPIIDNILSVGAGIYSPTNSPVSFLQLILDHSALNCYISDGSHGQLHSIEFHCRRLCHALHTERYKLLSLVPKRQRKGAKNLKKRK